MRKKVSFDTPFFVRNARSYLTQLVYFHFLKIIFGSLGKVCFDDRIEQYTRLFEIDKTTFFTFSAIVPAIVSILFL